MSVFFRHALFALICMASAYTVSAQTGIEGRLVQLPDIAMHVEEMGTGEPLLLMHGFGGCAHDWAPFAKALSTQFRVIVPDLRGHGRSGSSEGDFSHRQAATDVLALLDAMGLQQFKAIGISSGGMALLHVATRAPTRIEAMVLVGVAPYFPEQARAITRRAAEQGPRPGDLDYYRRCAGDAPAHVQALARQFAGLSRSYDDVNFTPPLLGTIRARTLLVHGDRDEFFPARLSVEMHEAIPASALWIVPSGAHVPIYGTQQAAFIETARAFLTGDDNVP